MAFQPPRAAEFLEHDGMSRKLTITDGTDKELRQAMTLWSMVVKSAESSLFVLDTSSLESSLAGVSVPI